MHTTDFSTLCCKKRLEWCAAGLRLLLAACLFFAAFFSVRSQASGAEIGSLRVEQSAEGLYLSASLRFELPAAVEEALLKGIALSFVAEAQVYRDRWYWYDKSIVTASRTIRLSFVPLTRRWRVSLGAGGLAQSFESLPEALAAISRISRWKIAEASEVDSDSRHNVDFRFRLDTTQLPRPLQFGLSSSGDWQIAAARNIRPEVAR